MSDESVCDYCRDRYYSYCEDCDGYYHDDDGDDHVVEDAGEELLLRDLPPVGQLQRAVEALVAERQDRPERLHHLVLHALRGLGLEGDAFRQVQPQGGLDVHQLAKG